jgi:hypothetical protein
LTNSTLTEASFIRNRATLAGPSGGASSSLLEALAREPQRAAVLGYGADNVVGHAAGDLRLDFRVTITTIGPSPISLASRGLVFPPRARRGRRAKGGINSNSPMHHCVAIKCTVTVILSPIDSCLLPAI